MRSSVLLLAVVVALQLVSSVSGNAIIFDDLTSGVTVVLVAGLTNPAASDATYNTVSDTYTMPSSSAPRSFNPPVDISLYWADDLADV